MDKEIQLLVNVVESSEDAIISKSLDGIIASWNKGAELTYGYSAEEVIGKNISILAPSQLKDEVNQLIKKIKDGKKVYHYDTIRISKDSKQVYVSISLSPIFDNSRNLIGISTIARDITKQKESELALKESEEKYREVFNNANDMIGLNLIRDDGLPGKFVDINQIGIERLGYSRDEFLNMTPADIISPEKLSEMPKNALKLSEQRHGGFETIHLTKNGEKIPVEVNIHIFKLKGKKLSLAISRNITERKKTLESLQKSEYDILRAQQIGHLGSIDWNIENNTLECSKELYNIFSVDKEFEFTFESIENMIHPEDREKNLKIVNNLLKNDNRAEYEFRIIRPTGEIRHIHQIINVIRDKNGNAKQACGIMQDITKQKQAENDHLKTEKLLDNVYTTVKKQAAKMLAANVVLKAEIKERKRMEQIIRDNVLRMNLALESADMGALDLDILNDTTIRTLDHDIIFGYDSILPEWGLKIFFEHVLPEDREYVQQRFEKSYETNKLYFQSRIIRADKEIRWIEAYGNVYKDDKGVPIRILGVISDITERKETETQLLAAVDEKELLLREIHHRVKNNMQIISSLLNLQSSQVFDKRDTDLFTVVQDRVKSMGLIHGSLYLSKDLSSINFNEYSKTLISELLATYAVNSKINLVTNIVDVSLNIETAIPLGLIINELVTNSLKHAFPDSKGEISITVHIKGEEFELIFKDNGVGLPDDFNFENPKKLGLKLVKSLVEQIEGTIKLDQSHGTEFKIKFRELKYKERI